MTKQSKAFLLIIIVLIIVLLILVIGANYKAKSNYDISMMHEVNVSDVLTMFDSGDTYVLFVGREGCVVCKNILPALKEAQTNNNYITQYLDITKVDRSSDEWKSLVNKLSMRSTQTISETGEGELVTETYGYFLHNYGFTPTLIVVKDGKQTAGFIGNTDKDELIAWLTEKVS